MYNINLKFHFCKNVVILIALYYNFVTKRDNLTIIIKFIYNNYLYNSVFWHILAGQFVIIVYRTLDNKNSSIPK